jgi:hypothetical protein
MNLLISFYMFFNLILICENLCNLRINISPIKLYVNLYGELLCGEKEFAVDLIDKRIEL